MRFEGVAKSKSNYEGQLVAILRGGGMELGHLKDGKFMVDSRNSVRKEDIKSLWHPVEIDE